MELDIQGWAHPGRCSTAAWHPNTNKDQGHQYKTVAILTVFRRKAGSNLADTAGRIGDVLAHENYPLVGGHRLVESLVDRCAKVDLFGG